MNIGDAVVIERAAPSKGTWPRYAGRRGVIVGVSVQETPGRRRYIEYGVSFDKTSNVTAWFLPSEVRKAESGGRTAAAKRSGGGTEGVNPI